MPHFEWRRNRLKKNSKFIKTILNGYLNVAVFLFVSKRRSWPHRSRATWLTKNPLFASILGCFFVSSGPRFSFSFQVIEKKRTYARNPESQRRLIFIWQKHLQEFGHLKSLNLAHERRIAVFVVVAVAVL